MSERFDDMTEAFHDHLTALGVPLFALGPGNKHPAGWQHSAVENNADERAKGRQTAGICALMGGRVAVVDVDGKAGADIADVQRSLDDAGVRVYARVRTPSAGGFHLYVAAPPGQRTLHANRDRASLDLPGTEVIAAGGNVFAPGTRRAKYDGRGYTILWDRLDQLAGDDGSRFAAWVAAHTKVPASTQGRAQREYRAAPADGAHPYVAAAVEAECAGVASTPPGGRNAALNVAAFNLGQLVGAGVLDAHEATGRLLDAAAACGLGEAEARGTIRSGLEAGSKQPRGIPESDRWEPRPEGGPEAAGGPEDDHPEGGGGDRTSAPWPAVDPIIIGSGRPFPVDVLPKGMAEAVREVAEAVQVDAAIPATAFLGVAAGTLGARTKVVITDTWQRYANLYLTVVADSGDGKSPGFSPAMGPLEVFSDQLHAEADEAKRLAKVRLPILKQRLMQMQKGIDDPGSVAIAEMMDLQQMIDDSEADLGRDIRATVDDVTPEQLERLLADNGGVLTAWNDEGALLAHMLGMYAPNPNLGVFLKAWDGSTIESDRKGGAGSPATKVLIKNPRLTVVAAVQPTVIERLGEPRHRDLVGRGVVGRLLIAWPQSRAGTRMLAGREDATYRAVPAWNDKIATMLTTEDSTVVFDPEARQVFLRWHDRVERSIKEGCALSEIRAFAVKTRDAVPRFAGLFARIEGSSLVRVEHVQRGIELGEYYLAHADAVFESWSSGHVNIARKLLAKLRRQHDLAMSEGGAVFTVRDAARWAREKTEDVIAALEVLEQHGYVRPTDPNTRFGVAGQRAVGMKSPYVYANPALFDIPPEGVKAA